MNADERLLLQKMIKANDVEDQSELIRTLKHSYPLQEDINRLLQIKHAFKDDETLVHEKASTECSFLYQYYTDIFNKIKKNEIDLSILNKFLNILRNIEDGIIDQHEGSFYVGSILKELYVDCALRKADKINENKEINIENEHLNISFKEYKLSHNKTNLKN
jgi:hypothetical protein